MIKKPNPELIDEDNPEWTEEKISRARLASDVLPELFPSNSELRDCFSVSGHPAKR